MYKKETSSKTFRFSNDVLEKLKVLSEQDNRSMNNYVSNILANHLKQFEQPNNVKLTKEQYKDWQVKILSILTGADKTAKEVWLSLKNDNIEISERGVREFLKSEEKEGGIKAVGKSGKAIVYHKETNSHK